MGVFSINHVAFRTSDGAAARVDFNLLGAEVVVGAHDPLRVGSTLLVFFEATGPAGQDEIAFDADAGVSTSRSGVRGRWAEVTGPVEHTAWSRGFYVTDQDGRRLEVTYDNRGVYWQA